MKAGRIFLVRHGQASFGEADYDRLSPLGEQQTTKLGEYWYQQNIKIDAIFSGSLKRHLGSAKNAAIALNNADLLTGIQIVPNLNEYNFGPMVINLARRNLEGSVDWPYYRSNKDAYLDLLRKGMQSNQWINAEPWNVFQQRCASGLHAAIEAAGKGLTVAVFSSAGTIGALLKQLTGKTDSEMIESAVSLFNASVTTLIVQQDQTIVGAFNCTAHLQRCEESEQLHTLL